MYNRSIQLKCNISKSTYVFNILAKDCTTLFTTISPQKGKKCIFPFTSYGGRTFRSCTRRYSGGIGKTLWCSTKVTENGVHIQDKWGECDPSCPQKHNYKHSTCQRRVLNSNQLYRLFFYEPGFAYLSNLHCNDCFVIVFKIIYNRLNDEL